MAHLRFALRHEPVDPGVLVAACQAIEPDDLEGWVRAEPTGAFSRRAWFFYETFTSRTLDLGDARMDEQARALIERSGSTTLSRAVNSLYTKETRSSFAIEGETPSASRTERFVAALREAQDFDPTDKGALIRLQGAIVDPRYAATDWRDFQNFVGATVGGYREEVHFICPVSAAMLRDRRSYDEILETLSRPILEFIRWRWTAEQEIVVGNMFAGSVVEAGTVAGLRAGDRVFAYGGFRESHVLPAERCYRLEPGVSWKSALCLDPAVFAMGAVRDGSVRLGDRVAVFGLGAIGLVVVQMARLAGAPEVLAVDPIALRRDVAERTGATRTLDPSACDAGREIKLATGGAGVDVAIEYSGSVPGLQQAFRAVAFGGTVVCGAYPGPHPAGLDLGAEAHFNRPNVVFSRVNSDPSRDHPRWDEQRVYRACLRLIADRRLDGDEIVQPVVPFADLAEEYPKIANEPETLVKLGVDY